MPSLYQQLAMTYDGEKSSAGSGESLDRAEQQRDPLQLQQQLDRSEGSLGSHLDRDSLKLQTPQTQERDSLLHFQASREHLHRQQQRRDREQQQQLLQHRETMRKREQHSSDHLQSINNLLFDLPSSVNKHSPSGSSSSSFFHSSRPHDSPALPKSPSTPEVESPFWDLFDLSMPRGSLMGNQSANASSNYRQQYHGHAATSSHLNYPQYEDNYGHYSNSLNSDVPSTPNSVTTPASPSTPGSLYSNPYTYPNSGESSASCLTPSPPNRPHYNVGWSPSSSSGGTHTSYHGRPIRGSPPYSDYTSSILEYPYSMGFGGSRSTSPSDSETSGYSSIDSSLSDIMVRNCLSLNSGHSCYPPSLHGSMPHDLDIYHGEKRAAVAAAYQRMASKKYHQQQQLSNLRHHYCCPSGNYTMSVYKSPNIMEPHISLDRAARCHRNAAALCEATYKWSGELPKRTPKSVGYSSKVFVGGVPYDVTETLLISTFKQFGPIRVEWPGKEQSESQPKGYAYIIFESEKQVKALLAACNHRLGDESSWYYKITPKRSKPKDVQIIPWHISDSNYSKSASQKLDPEKTVFVGALHGMLTAEGLAKIMDELFEEVIYAGIDTDKWKYPIGSARVTFGSKRSYKKACAAAFVEIKTDLFTKKVQIDPYIEDSVCSTCTIQHGPYFCREPICSRYFCRGCWLWQHDSEPMRHHQPMSRGSKTKMIMPMGGHIHHSSMNFGGRSKYLPVI